MSELKPPKNWPSKTNCHSKRCKDHNRNNISSTECPVCICGVYSRNSAIDACWQAHIESLPTEEELKEYLLSLKYVLNDSELEQSEAERIAQVIYKLIHEKTQ